MLQGIKDLKKKTFFDNARVAGGKRNDKKTVVQKY